MAADIIKCTQNALAIANHEDALADDIKHQMIARLGQLFLAPSAIPVAAEDPLLLKPEGVLGVVPARWQGLLEPAHGGQRFVVHGKMPALGPDFV